MIVSGQFHTMPELRGLNLRGVQAHTLLSRASLGLALFFAILVAYQSLIPTTSMPTITHADKVMHFIAYAVLGGLFTLGLPRIRASKICIAIISYGVIIEILQQVMALGRTGSLLDGLANTGGAISGTALATYFTAIWFLARE